MGMERHMGVGLSRPRQLSIVELFALYLLCRWRRFNRPVSVRRSHWEAGISGLATLVFGFGGLSYGLTVMESRWGEVVSMIGLAIIAASCVFWRYGRRWDFIGEDEEDIYHA